MNYDEILDSVQLIAKEKTKELGFDKTILATIIKVDNEKYTLSDSTSTFTAFSSNGKSYEENDIVYVTIPGGDYENDKWIIGLASTQKIYKEIDFEGSFSEISFQEILEGEYGLLANGETETLNIFTSSDTINTSDYWYLGIASQISTNIPNVAQGDYGIRVKFNTKDKSNTFTYELNTSNMTGALYSQDVAQAVYYFMDKTSIDGYEVEIFQNNDFLYEDGSNLSYGNLNNKKYTNIVFSNIKIYIGEINDIEEQFINKHYAKASKNSGLVLGKRANGGGIFAYDNKEETFALDTNGTFKVGNFSIQNGESNFKNLIHFDINNNINFNPNSDYALTISNAILEEGLIKESKANFESTLFSEHFQAIEETKRAFFVDCLKGDDLNDGINNPFYTLSPILTLLDNGLPEAEVVFLSPGIYSFNNNVNIKSIALTFSITKDIGEIFIDSDSALNFENSFLKIKANYPLSTFVFNNDVSIKYSYIDFSEVTFNNLTLSNTKGNISDSSIQKCDSNKSKVHFQVTELDYIWAEDSDNIFTDCTFNNSQDQVIGKAHNKFVGGNQLIEGNATKIEKIDGEARAENFIHSDGAQISITTIPSFANDFLKNRYKMFLKNQMGSFISNDDVINACLVMQEQSGDKNEIDFSMSELNPTKVRTKTVAGQELVGATVGTFPIFAQTAYNGFIGTCVPTTAAVIIDGLKGLNLRTYDVCSYLQATRGFDEGNTIGCYSNTAFLMLMSHWGISATSSNWRANAAAALASGSAMALHVWDTPWRGVIGRAPFPAGGQHFVTLYGYYSDGTTNYVDTSDGVGGKVNLQSAFSVAINGFICSVSS